jgi:hypothetical protein
LRDLPRAVDLVRVHLFAQESLQLIQKRISLITILSALLGKGEETREAGPPHEKLLGEAALFTRFVAGRLGQLQRRTLTRGHFGGVDQSSGLLSSVSRFGLRRR